MLDRRPPKSVGSDPASFPPQEEAPAGYPLRPRMGDMRLPSRDWRHLPKDAYSALGVLFVVEARTAGDGELGLCGAPGVALVDF